MKKVFKIDRPDGRRVLKFDGALGPEGCGSGFAEDYKKRGRGLRRRLCRRVVFASAQGATAFQAEGCGGALRAQIIKKPARALPSFRPKPVSRQ